MDGMGDREVRIEMRLNSVKRDGQSGHLYPFSKIYFEEFRRMINQKVFLNKHFKASPNHFDVIVFLIQIQPCERLTLERLCSKTKNDKLMPWKLTNSL